MVAFNVTFAVVVHVSHQDRAHTPFLSFLIMFAHIVFSSRSGLYRISWFNILIFLDLFKILVNINPGGES